MFLYNCSQFLNILVHIQDKLRNLQIQNEKSILGWAKAAVSNVIRGYMQVAAEECILHNFWKQHPVTISQMNKFDIITL